jgi:hypothetical protein
MKATTDTMLYTVVYAIIFEVLEYKSNVNAGIEPFADDPFVQLAIPKLVMLEQVVLLIFEINCSLL